jgi:hypothetical protein
VGGADTRTRGGAGAWIRALALAVALLALWATPAHVAFAQAPATDPSAAARADLVRLLDSVPAGASYRTTDSTGATVDTIKIIAGALPGSYIGVYHVLSGGGFSTRLATSSDLVHWAYQTTLATAASQPTIAALPSGGYLVAVEKFVASLLGLTSSSSHLEFLYYPTLDALLAASAAQTFDASNQLSSAHEGTPSIGSVSVGAPAPGTLGLLGGAPLSNSTISVGFHYDSNPKVGLDRNATGVLTNFSNWTEEDNPQLNSAFPPSVKGSIGGRDYVTFEGFPFTVIEAQTTPRSFASFRVYLWDPSAQLLTALAPGTARGSLAFGNPKVAVVTDPAGKRALVSSLYVFSEAAGAGEAGPLTYYNEF